VVPPFRGICIYIQFECVWLSVLFGSLSLRDLLKLLGFLHAAVRHINTVMCKKCSSCFVCVCVRGGGGRVGVWRVNNMASWLPHRLCSCSCGPSGAHCHA